MSGTRSAIVGTALAIALALVWSGDAEALNPSHECSFCHGLHGAPGTQLKNEADVEVLCMSCHGSTGISSLKADVHTNDAGSAYAPFRISCLPCHDPHSNRNNWLGPHDHAGTTVPGVNIKLVGSRGASGVAEYQTTEWDAGAGAYVSGTRNVVFEQTGDNTDPDLKLHSFADNDQDGNGVKDGACETCHSQTKHHCNGDPTNTGRCGTSHNTGKTCTGCHYHDTNFQRN